MTRKLDKHDQAYNACIDALNEAEDRLSDAARARSCAWNAAESIHPCGTHGKRQTGNDVSFDRNGNLL